MPDFKAKIHPVRFPLDELTALPRSLYLRGILRGEGREEKGKGKER